MKDRKTWIATFAGALVALPAAAAEGAEPGGVFAGNVGNALWTLVIFGLVVFVLGKFAWKPILGGLQQREQFIRASLEQAKKDREEAEARLKEYVDKLNSARAEATAIVEEARRDAEVVRRRIEEEGRAESSAIVDRARREVTIAAETAKKELYEVSAKLATELAGRLLGREIQAGDHERLIRESIDSIERGSN